MAPAAAPPSNVSALFWESLQPLQDIYDVCERNPGSFGGMA